MKKENNLDNMIKGRIGETIAEQLFRELGFYVIKFGKEYTAAPLNQLEKFAKFHNIEFKPNKPKRCKSSGLYDVDTYLRTLPDFVIKNPRGELRFLEVKFRKDAYLKDYTVLRVYRSIILLINSYVSEGALRYLDNQAELRNSRFHVWELEALTPGEIDTTSKEELDEFESKIKVESLSKWLKRCCNIENPEIIKKYEDYVSKWLSVNSSDGNHNTNYQDSIVTKE